MKKDIPILKVTDIVVAVVPREDEEEFWDVYLVNLKPLPIQAVLVNSVGYGEVEGEKVKTTTMRYFFDDIPAEQYIKIEPIMTNLLSIANEYWISFSYNGYLYDKKYIFVEGSIDKMNFTTVPLLNMKGVMIR